MSADRPLPSPDLLYLTPDLTDPAARRRRAMLEAGGADVSVAGFVRGSGAPPDWAAAVLGRTRDAALLQRVMAVLGQLARPWLLRRLARGRDAVIARNLEMLVLAWISLLLAGSRAPLTYEVLDLHRMMVAPGPAGRILRALENLLLRRANLLIISSPAFDRVYFSRWSPRRPPRLLVENKVLVLEGPAPSPSPPPATPPWRIGWFGMLRCRRSLDILADLAAQSGGAVEVVIRGRPSPAVFGNAFEALVSDRPGLVYGGPYVAEDLPALYGAVHFVWGVDFFEAGLNSAWLLPNRLYEGEAFGRPLIAEAGVETGGWLAARGAGVLFASVETELLSFFQALTPADYEARLEAVAKIPLADLVADREDCVRLVQSLSEPTRA